MEAGEICGDDDQFWLVVLSHKKTSIENFEQQSIYIVVIFLLSQKKEEK